MYFEASKKTYRFPSSSSMNDFHAKYYYPEQHHTSGEATHSNMNATYAATTQRTQPRNEGAIL